MQVERAGSDDLYADGYAETWFERRGYRTIDATPC